MQPMNGTASLSSQGLDSEWCALLKRHLEVAHPCTSILLQPLECLFRPMAIASCCVLQLFVARYFACDLDNIMLLVTPPFFAPEQALFCNKPFRIL